MHSQNGNDQVSCACKGIRTCLRCEQVKGKGAFETNYPEVIISLDILCYFSLLQRNCRSLSVSTSVLAYDVF